MTSPVVSKIVARCNLELQRTDQEGRLSDDSMQLVATLLGDRALLEKSTTMQLPVLTLSALSSLSRVSELVDAMLERSGMLTLETCVRFVGTMFMTQCEHWISFEVVQPMAPASQVCRNITVYDSLLEPGDRHTFIARLVLAPEDPATGKRSFETRVCIGDYEDYEHMKAARAHLLVEWVHRVMLLLEMYRHRYVLGVEQINSPAMLNPEALELMRVPDFGKMPNYLVTVRAYPTQQHPPHIDCGVFALRHREAAMCSPALIRTDTLSGPAYRSMNDHLRCIHAPKKLQDAVQNMFSGNSGVDSRFLVAQASEPPAVHPREARETYSRLVLDRSWFAATKPGAIYGVLKALEWTLTRLASPRRITYRNMGELMRNPSYAPGVVPPVPLRDPKGPRWVIILCTGLMQRKTWLEHIQHLLLMRGLHHDWEVRTVYEPAYYQPPDPDTPMQLDTHHQRLLGATRLFFNVSCYDETAHMTDDEHHVSLDYGRRWLALNTQPPGKPQEPLTFLNAFQMPVKSCARCIPCIEKKRCEQLPPYTPPSSLDWHVQIGSTLPVPSMSLPLPVFMQTVRAPYVMPAMYVETDVISLGRGYLNPVPDEPVRVDVSHLFRTMLYCTGWDPLHEVDRFDLTGIASPASPSECAIVPGPAKTAHRR